MHYHLEIILPPTDDIKKAVTEIMAPFDESPDEINEDDPCHHSFWDWWVIGGRWAGAKLEAMFDAKRLEKFREKLSEMKITVSGLQAGKQTLQPVSQIPIVDALWCEYFPDSPIKVCPLFDHYNSKYENSEGFPDIMPLKDMPKNLTASHLIIAKRNYDDSKFEARYMTQEKFWNGVSYLETKWDGKVLTALEEYKKDMSHYKEEYCEKYLPKDDWLVVTVDYHS